MYSKRKGKVRLNYFRVGVTLLLLVILIFGISLIISSFNKKPASVAEIIVDSQESVVISDSESSVIEQIEESEPAVFYPVFTDKTVDFYLLNPEFGKEENTEAASEISEAAENSEIIEDNAEEVRKYNSLYAIVVDTETNEIVAEHDYNVKMYPASLTKIMTLIVAAENTDNLEETVLITADMIDPLIAQEASVAGFAAGETPTVKDLIYGVVLPSGADAAVAVARHVGGSEEAFVSTMNDKVKELGLKNTHFTNPVGLHDPENYSTAEDIAIILEYALKNDFCREVLETYEYKIAPTEYNPEGLTLTSTMFSRMTGTEMPGVVVKGGKTGFTDESGQCLASFAEINGKIYVMVLADGWSKWETIYETLSGYSVFCYGGEPYVPPVT